MKNGNYLYDDSLISAIRQQLQIIAGVLINGDQFSKIQANCSSKAALLRAIDYLEKVKDEIPLYYGKEIDFLVRGIRHKLSLESNFIHDYRV